MATKKAEVTQETAGQAVEPQVQEVPQAVQKHTILYPIDPYRDDQEETFTNNGKVIRITRGKRIEVSEEDYIFLTERMEAEQTYYEERRRTQAAHSGDF